MKTIITLAISFLPFFNLQAEDDFAQEVIKSTPLTKNLFMLEGAGGNMTALLGADGVLLVDADFAPMAPKIIGELQKLGGQSPRFLINTHFHYDHSGGNEVFGTTATIIAATAVRDRLQTEQTLWRKQHPPVPRQALPTLTFAQELILHQNETQVRVVHFPHGHTDGDAVVFFNQGKVVSMGDLYFSGMFPIFHPEHKGGLKNLIQNLKLILAQIPTDSKIVPGHGPLSNKEELKKYVQMIILSRQTVKDAMKKGLTLEQIQKAGLPSFCEPFSHGYANSDRFIEMIYKDL